MRLGYGWPKLYSTAVPSNIHEAEPDAIDGGDVVSIEDLTDYIVLVFRASLQLWSGGQVLNPLNWHCTRMSCTSCCILKTPEITFLG